ncbi:hypothetical protein ADL03_06965, partial [Nocardia sp. NRRL S-836]
MAVASSSDLTTGRPRGRFGNKRLSIPTRWIQSDLGNAASSSARRAKSADRMLGAIIGVGTTRLILSVQQVEQ